jgi:anti-sigma factor RsiW
MTEINGAKSQWEALVDLVSQGYGDAYKAHKAALDAIRKKRKEDEEVNRTLFQLTFTVVAVGFSGGAAGSVLAPWTKEVAAQAAKYAYREGAKGVVSEAAKKLVGAALAQLESRHLG